VHVWSLRARRVSTYLVGAMRGTCLCDSHKSYLTFASVRLLRLVHSTESFVGFYGVCMVLKNKVNRVRLFMVVSIYNIKCYDYFCFLYLTF